MGRNDVSILSRTSFIYEGVGGGGNYIRGFTKIASGEDRKLG